MSDRRVGEAFLAEADASEVFDAEEDIDFRFEQARDVQDGGGRARGAEGFVDHGR